MNTMQELPFQTNSPARNKRLSLLVFLFYLSAFLFLSSGRISSGDAGAQLEATMLLVNTGNPGTRALPNDPPLWVRHSNGIYYESHDIGNILLMYPAAWLGSRFSHLPLDEKLKHPPILSRVGVALSYSILSAIASYFMYCLFGLFYPHKTSFYLSLAFVTTTIFWAYSKSSWDVLGAACFMCPLLYYSAVILKGEKSFSPILAAGLSLAVACAFRYSLTPFLILSLISVFYFARRSIKARHFLACGAVILIGMMPSFFYNYIRMGSPWQPATAAPQFMAMGTSNLHGNIATGLPGLTLSPNKGLLIFSPIFLLLFTLPVAWRQLTPSARQLGGSFGIGALLYLLVLSKLQAWGTFGWGPRHLLPVIPILFFLTASTMMVLWNRHKRLLCGLIGLSLLVCAPPAFVNWNLAISGHPGAGDPYARLPYQHIAIWENLILGLQGKLPPGSEALVNDPIRSGGARFPDLWTFRLMEQSRTGLLAGLALSILLVGLSAWSLARLLRWKTDAESQPTEFR